MAGQNHFYSTFTAFRIQCKRGIRAASLCKMLMNRTLNPVTDSKVKRWLQGENPLRSQLAKAATKTQAEQNCSSINGSKFRAERTCFAEKNLRRVKLSHDYLIQKYRSCDVTVVFNQQRFGSRISRHQEISLQRETTKMQVFKLRIFIIHSIVILYRLLSWLFKL